MAYRHGIFFKLAVSRNMSNQIQSYNHPEYPLGRECTCFGSGAAVTALALAGYRHCPPAVQPCRKAHTSVTAP